MLQFIAIFYAIIASNSAEHQSRSHATRLPWFVVVLPLVLCRLSFVSRHPPPSVSASVFITPLHLWCGRLSSAPAACHVISYHAFASHRTAASHYPISSASCLAGCHVVSHHAPLVSCASCPAGCCVASHHADSSQPPAPPPLVVTLPLISPLLSLLPSVLI